ncbi:MAG: hypothetical protein WCI72_02725 [archaeon]
METQNKIKELKGGNEEMNEKLTTCQIITLGGQDYLLHKDFLKTKQPLMVGTDQARVYSYDEMPLEGFPHGEDANEYCVFYEPSDEMLNLAKHLKKTGHNEEFAKLEQILIEMIGAAQPVKMKDPLGVHDRYYQKRRPFPSSVSGYKHRDDGKEYTMLS